MPSKTRWKLNPKKWFGQKANALNKREINNHLHTQLPPPPTATTTTRTIPSIVTVPRISSGKNKVKVVPITVSNDTNKNCIMMTQFQLPAFGIRRERTTSTFSRQNTFLPTHTEPTIRKNSRIEEGLSIDVTRLSIPTIHTKICEDSEENIFVEQVNASVLDISQRCVVDYPRHEENRIEECSLPSRSSSSSSINDENDNSSSSGIFTDERQRTESKGTLSTLEVLSIESIADSQTSLNHSQARPIIHHYRRPMSVFQIIDDHSQQTQNSLRRSHRSQSAEGILKDNQTISSSKSRQSSAAIVKKIEKRVPTSRSPSTTLEKSGFIRITNDTYRLTDSKTEYASCHSRKNSTHSFVPYTTYDDVLRSANDEECYATLPRTSSTEQLNNNNLQNDLRVMVNECIGPMVTSIGKTRPTKTNRYKRSHPHTQLNIDNLTAKLFSSIDYSIYTRYQRCN